MCSSHSTDSLHDFGLFDEVFLVHGSLFHHLYRHVYLPFPLSSHHSLIRAEGGERERERGDRKREGGDRKREGGDRKRGGGDRKRVMDAENAEVYSLTPNCPLPSSLPSVNSDLLISHASSGIGNQTRQQISYIQAGTLQGENCHC